MPQAPEPNQPQQPPQPQPQSPQPERITDLSRLKAFTNPLRMQLYRLLYAAGTATASQLAEQVDQAPSLVSYHLRKLAEHGFVTEAETQSTDGRERWWQVSSEEGWGFRESDLAGTPEGAAVVGTVTRSLVDTRVAQYRTYLDQTSAWGSEWTDAAFSAEWLLDLTPAELAELSDELQELGRRWRERGKAARAAGATEGREHVAVHVYGFPFRP
ncbi:ArsR/SmtB family transcription factor [Kitasatospora sp. NPDC058162]|uniref:ArsR/SmtB family transcription factor n=1 Tax=Kitasatospora sp. NPDC058162 TaxID=3346362 RepID=UPI0036DC8104